MKTPQKTTKVKKQKKTVPLLKILERVNELQSLTDACMEFGLESQQIHTLFAKEGKKIDRVYDLVPLEPHEKSEIKDRKYHLNMDIHEIMKVLNETRNMEITCTRLGVSALGITGLLRRNGFKIGRRYVARPYTEAENAVIEEKKRLKKAELLEKKKLKELSKKGN